MTLIQQEAILSRTYWLDMIPSHDLVALTQQNVAKVEAMIHTDSNYSNTTDTSNGYSSAFWLTQLDYYLHGTHPCIVPYKTIITNCVESIDRENSTHLNSDGVGRNELTDRLIDKFPNGIGLEDHLHHPQKYNYDIIELLSMRTTYKPPKSTMKNRVNFSFATKFCHYAAFYLFTGAPEADNFSIIDNILKNNIKNYADYFSCKRCIAYMNWLNEEYKLDNTSKSKTEPSYADIYKAYLNLVDTIRDTAALRYGKEISRNGFDHLLWYYHKGRTAKPSPLTRLLGKTNIAKVVCPIGSLIPRLWETADDLGLDLRYVDCRNLESGNDLKTVLNDTKENELTVIDYVDAAPNETTDSNKWIPGALPKSTGRKKYIVVCRHKQEKKKFNTSFDNYFKDAKSIKIEEQISE